MLIISDISKGLKTATEPETFNDQIINNMNSTLDKNLILFEGLTNKINHNYKITIILYVVSFGFGLALLSIPIFAVVLGGISYINAVIGAFAGIADIAVVLLSHPIERIHEIIADNSQITIITSSYQEQVGLRLLESDINDRKSMGIAADKIDLATKSAILNIQKYCEVKAAPEQKNMMEEIIKKLQELMKKKEKDKPDKK